jgi:SH3-like domain-containing protein
MPWNRPKIPRTHPAPFAQTRFSAWIAAILAAGVASGLLGCQREEPEEAAEFSYVSGANVEFRNELGPASQVMSHLQSGDRVRVVSRRPRWAQVQNEAGETGWVLQRALVSQEVYGRFVGLAQEAEALPSQGRAVIRRTANLHIEPGRDTLAFYQLTESELAKVVGHRVVPREPAPAAAPAGESAATQADIQARNNEDWLLVRASDGRAGWLLEGAADMNPPIEVAQYREGLRIRAWFEIHRELDQGEEHAWYLWATVRRLAGLPYDFDEIRVFVWNPRASRYETAHRERNLTGFYPIVVGKRETSEGAGPTFRLQLEDSSGRRFEKSYFMVGRQVRVEP